MNDIFGLLAAIIVPFIFPILIYATLSTIGIIIERRHLKELNAREQALGPFLLLTTKSPPPGLPTEAPFLVTGGTVIGGGFLKNILAQIRSVFGGEMASYTKVLDRGRREARLRMAEEATRQGAQAIINVRFETSDIGGTNNRAAISEIFCYGTALK